MVYLVELIIPSAQRQTQAAATPMQAAVNKMGNKIQDDDLQMLMAAADVDGSGSIDYEEFVAATVNLSKLEKEENFMQASPACLAYVYSQPSLVSIFSK